MATTIETEQLRDAQALLADLRDHIRPAAVMNPSAEAAALKIRIDAALLHLPAPIPAARIPGCADAAWLIYDKGLYGQHGVLVMPGATIISKATSYAGYKAPNTNGA